MNRFVKDKFSCFVKGLVAFFALSFSIYFTTCDMPMGLGDPIDWEAPVLTLEPVPPNPMYVREGTVIGGRVTDNIAVDRVIMRDAGSGKEMFRATINGDRWEIALEFTKEQNGEKIMVEVVAFDTFGNSGDSSIKAVTLIIDIRPPFIDDIWIERTITKTAYLEKYNDLKDLETTDPRGERSDNVNRYQNGNFYINAKVSEEETRIEIVSLNIYDTRYPDIPLLELTLPPNTSAFSPSWLVEEEKIIAAGDLKIGGGYRSTYYDSTGNQGRYYYRVVIIALDRSKNESENRVAEDEGFFCMWNYGDVPKGILDPLVGTVVTRGATFPVEFYEDDALQWAYTGILTRAQWDGTKTENNVTSPVYIASGTQIPQYPGDSQSESDNKKLEWLKKRLRGEENSGDVYNWNYDIHYSAITDSDKITNQITGDSVDEKIVYLQTGNTDDDYGDFVLFTLTADKKLSPQHDLTYSGPLDTLKPRWKGRVWYVSVVDENKPLIVLDTVNTGEEGYDDSKHLGSSYNEPIANARTGNSPEESTFPKLRQPGGRLFEINGYTLRANRTSDGAVQNSVRKFRMAWIPFGMPNGADTYVTEVQRALSATGYPGVANTEGGRSMDALEALGIQHWNFIPEPDPVPAGNATLFDGTAQTIGDSEFVKQVFKKEFDILGGQDDIVTSARNGNTYRNFTYNGNLENEQKLFVIYAEDNMGHIVYRQMRLLPNKKPPDLAIYDISPRIDMIPVTSNDITNYYLQNTASSLFIPNINNSPYGGQVTSAYDAALLNYNKDTTVYDALRGVGMSLPPDTLDAIRAQPFQTYTRGTTLKFWVRAERSGDLAIANITMKDMTFEDEKEAGSGYKSDQRALTYIEYYPDEATREFLFEATDTLGNVAQIKRIVSITNTALLESITTTEESGSYGIGKEIILRANFSGQVRITGNPQLQVRYPVVAGTTGAVQYPAGSGNYYVYQSIPCEPVTGSTLFLEFKFTVPAGATDKLNSPANAIGRLETMYEGLGGRSGENAKPIRLVNNNGVEFATITDPLRDRPAYVPGYNSGTSSHPNWPNANNSLQSVKDIRLDGVLPVITGVTVDGKTPYATAGQNGATITEYYFKTDETLTLTFTSAAGDNIKPSENTPRLSYRIRVRNNNGTYTYYPSATTSYNTAFTYTRPVNSTSLVFSLPINATNLPYDGELVDIALMARATTIGTIEDEVGNGVSDNRLNNILGSNLMPSATQIFIKKAKPPQPTFRINGVTSTAITNPNYSTPSPYLNIDTSTTTNEQLREWEDRSEYSLNGGLQWVHFPTKSSGWTDDNTAVSGLDINGGTWVVAARYVDRAGNEGDPRTLPIQVNNAFPRLIQINADQPNGWYIKGQNLSFTLNFEDRVRVNAFQNVSITLKNRSANPDSTTGEQIVRATVNSGQNDYSQSITLYWNDVGNPTEKEMKDGLYISNVTLIGLRDRFGNAGGEGTASYNSYNIAMTTPSHPAVPNLLPGLMVDAIKPNVTARTPDVYGVSSYPGAAEAPDKRNVITLTFNEAVKKGNGTITIKPQTNFLIPPVFEDNGYYMDCVTEIKASGSSNRTIWVPGFYDIYNNTALNATDRNRLTESTTEASQRATPTNAVVPSSEIDNTNPSMTRLRLDGRTGQPVGPYVKTTQGLKSGYGYSGHYYGGNNTTGNTSDSAETAFFKQGPNTDGSASGLNGAMPAFTAMIPDTATKWVLAYQYSIHNAAASQEDPRRTANGYGKAAVDANVVPNIRAVLVKTKFRWQEIDVAWSNVVLTTNASGQGVATITLNEPLLKGLQWEISYGEGTFIDDAGNSAIAEDYTFWSEGVQKPVIRVNRKSYDARGANWQTPRGANDDTRSYTYAAPAAGTGWGITDFNTVDYRIESETPGATIFYAVSTLSNSTTDGTGNGHFNAVSVTGNWTGNVPNVTAVTNEYTQDTWDRNTPDQPRSFWVRPNLIRRDGYSGQGAADVATARCRYYVNGDIRYSAGTLRMYRSYNRDATLTTADSVDGLNALTLTMGTQNQDVSWHKGTVTFDAYEAGKRYVVADARIINNGVTDYTSNKGYEGIFRTLIVLNGQNGQGRQNNNGEGTSRGKILVEGSNIKAGLPSVAGFPVQDGSDAGDSRFAKMMFNVDHANPNASINGGETTNQRFYWVSTEIVCEWYFVYFGNGGRYMRTGDVNNYMMVGYGDLTYGYRVHRFPD